MPVSILVVALVLVMSGLGGFGMGLSLMPTDMSRAWLVVGASLFSGGMVALAIGFGVQSLATVLMRADRQPAEAPRMPEPAASVAPALEAAPPPAAGGHAGMIAAGGALLGAGALAAHSFDRKTPDINTAQTSPEAPDADAWLALRPGHEPVVEPDAPEPVAAPAPADAFEQELFALSEAEREAASPVLAPEPPVAEVSLLPPFSALPTPDEPARDPEPDYPPAADLRIELPQTHEMEAAALEPEDEPEDHAALHAMPPVVQPDMAPIVQPDMAPALPPAVPGLIADEDLASLQAEAPPLAPLSSLEIVGAYDSGGVRFTMYSDGSVHAAGAGGEQRYASLEALRKRLDAGLPAV